MFLCILLIGKKFLLDVVSVLITLLSIDVSAALGISELDHETNGAQGKLPSLVKGHIIQLNCWPAIFTNAAECKLIKTMADPEFV